MVSNKPISVSRQVGLYAISFFFFAIGLLGFMQIGWLLGKPISDFPSQGYSESISVPENAKSYYMINHGDYVFFDDSPSSNHPKAAIIISMIVFGIGTSLSLNLYIVARKRKSKGR